MKQFHQDHSIALRMLPVFLLVLVLILLSLVFLNAQRIVAAPFAQSRVFPAGDLEVSVGAPTPFTPTGHFEAVFSPGTWESNYIPLVASSNLDNDGVIFATLVEAASNLNAIWKSLDGGRHWTAIPAPRSAYQIDIALSPDFANDQIVFALVGNYLYKSTDSGDHWTSTGAPQTSGAGYNRLVRLSPNYTVDHAIFVGMYDGYGIGGVYSSTNDGQTWELVTGDIARAVTDFDISPGYPDDPVMFVTSYNDGIFRSDNRGVTWTHLSNPQFSPEFRVALSPDFPHDNTLFVVANGISDGGAFRSNNRGDAWTSIKGGYYTHVLAVSPNFAQDQTVIVGDDYGYLYLSEDAGDTWYSLQGFLSIGIYGHKNSAVIVYENGLLRLLASNYETIYRYRWPSLGLSQISVPLEPGITDSFTVTVPLKPDDTAEMPWEVKENISWLSVMPLTGTLPSTLTLTVAAAELTGTTRASLTVATQWSLRQTETITVPILAMFVYGRVWLPIVMR